MPKCAAGETVAHRGQVPGLAPCSCGLGLLLQGVHSARVPQALPCPGALLALSGPSSRLVLELAVVLPALSGSWVGRLGARRWWKGR